MIMGILMAILFRFFLMEDYFFPSENTIVNTIKDVILTLKFELMAIGGLGAYMVFYHRERLETAWFFKPIFQVIFFGFLFIRIFLHLYIIENSAFIYPIYKFMIFTPVIGTFTEGGLFLWLILNTAINARTFLPLKNKFLDNLGEISYGIYMYQMLVIFGIVLIFKKFMLGLSPVLSHLFFYSSVTIGVICLAWLSKRYFENPFLRLKKRLG